MVFFHETAFSALLYARYFFWRSEKGTRSYPLPFCTILGLSASSPYMSLAGEVSYLFAYICFCECLVLFLCFCSLIVCCNRKRQAQIKIIILIMLSSDCGAFSPGHTGICLQSFPGEYLWL